MDTTQYTLDNRGRTLADYPRLVQVGMLRHSNLQDARQRVDG